MTAVSDIKAGTRVRFLPWPEEGIESEEVGTITAIDGPDTDDWFDPAGPMALFRPDPEFREGDEDFREIVFTRDQLAHTEVITS